MDTFSTVYAPERSTLSSIFGAVKLVSFIGSAFLAALLISQGVSINFISSAASNGPVIASVPLEYTNFPDVGKVASPHIDTKIITPSKSIPVKFLIDSGAKISALPMRYADETGLDKESVRRIYLRSATDNTTYGYLSDITLKMGEKNITLPVVYADVIEPLLGTYGFFDRYTVMFDRGEQIIIKEKS